MSDHEQRTIRSSAPTAKPGPRRVSAALVALATTFGVLALATASAQARTVHTFSSSFTGSGAQALSDPTGVAVDDETGDVYVVDAGRQRVEEFNAAGSTVLAEFDGAGAPDGALADPTPIAVDNSESGLDPSANDVYVTDNNGNVIYKFSAGGVFLEAISERFGGVPLENLDGLAVDPAGNLWVYEGSGLVAEFGDTGTPVESYETGRGAQSGLAVDADDDAFVTCCGQRVGEFSSNGTELREYEEIPGSVNALAIQPSTNDLFIDQGNEIVEYGPFGEPFLETLAFAETTLSGSEGVAVTKSGTVYATQGRSVEVFSQIVVSEVSAESASSITSVSATLTGVVNPAGVEVSSCRFEYGTSTTYGSSVPCSPAPGSGTGSVPVSADLTGLLSGTVYHYRLVAANEYGASETTDRKFTTRGVGISEQAAFSVEQTAATLEAQLNPRGGPTTYHFEYDTTPYTSEAAHGTSIPSPEASVGSGTSPVTVSVRITGLQSGETYYYRVVAVSELGRGELDKFYGPNESLVMPRPVSTQISSSCPNEQLRAEQPYGFTLPDCRAYEMVSPSDKEGNGISGSSARAAVSGNAVTYTSVGSFDEAKGFGFLSRYLSRRGPDGWLTKNVTPLYETHQDNTEPPFYELIFSPELSKGVLHERSMPLVRGEPAGYNNTFVADLENGTYQAVAPIPLGVNPYEEEPTDRPNAAGVSTDLSHVVFEASALSFLEGISGEPKLNHIYEWDGGKPIQVDVPPEGRNSKLMTL